MKTSALDLGLHCMLVHSNFFEIAPESKFSLFKSKENVLPEYFK